MNNTFQIKKSRPNDFYLRKKLKNNVQCLRVVHVSKKMPRFLKIQQILIFFNIDIFENKAFGLFNLTEISFV